MEEKVLDSNQQVESAALSHFNSFGNGVLPILAKSRGPRAHNVTSSSSLGESLETDQIRWLFLMISCVKDSQLREYVTYPYANSVSRMLVLPPNKLRKVPSRGTYETIQARIPNST